MQCLQLSEGGIYYFGAKFKLPLAGNMTKCELIFFLDQSCSVDSGSPLVYMGPDYGNYPGTGWLGFSTSVQAPVGSQSAYVACAFAVGGGETKMDQIYLSHTNSY